MYRGPIVPNGHGPWCGCLVCQACNRYSSSHYNASSEALYTLAELEKMRVAVVLEQRRREQFLAGLDPLTVAALYPSSQPAMADRQTPREGHPAVWLAVIGMLVALVMMSELLFWFH